MIYQPQYVKEFKINKEPKEILYEGINYLVFRNENDNVIKKYTFENIYELNEFIKTLDLEFFLSKQTDLLYASCEYQIVDTSTIYVQYKNLSNLIPQIIKVNAIEQQQQLEDQELYNELIGDNENLFEINLVQYQKQLLQKTTEMKVMSNLITTILKLYELELSGFMIVNIKNTNIIFEQEHLIFMDCFLQSCKFEVSLEEYLILDFIKQQYQSNYENVQNLAKCYIQLFLLIDFKEQQVTEYLELIQKYYGQNLSNLLQLMLFGQLRFFAQVMKSKEYLELVSPFDALNNKQLFQEFYESRKLQQQNVWDRISLRFQEDKQDTIWEQAYKSNLKFMVKPKSNPQYRLEYKINNLFVNKIEHLITGMIVLIIQMGQVYERGVMLITQNGKMLVFSTQAYLNTFDCSSKALRTIIKFNQDKQIYIAVGGDEKIVYIYMQNSFFSPSPQPLFKLSNEGGSQIYSLLGYDNILIYGDEDGIMYIYKKWQLFQTIKAHQKRCNTLIRFKNQIYSASFDQQIKVWDSFNFQIKHIITGHVATILELLIFDNYVYSFSDDQMLRVSYFKCGKFEFVYQSKFESSINTCIQYDEQSLILGDASGKILIFNMENRKLVHQCKNNLNSIVKIQWLSRSQNLFVNFGRDKILKINKLNT